MLANLFTTLSGLFSSYTGTSLIVEWVNVHLQGQNAQNQTTVEGPFTFQVILHKTGDIIFAYKTVPLHVVDIKDEDHPVKVGLSDAYIIDRTIFCKPRSSVSYRP